MEFIDDLPVIAHRVGFNGRIEVEPEDYRHVRDSHTVIWLVEAVCGPPRYAASGRDSVDRVRFNPQRLVRARILSGAQQHDAVAFLDDPNQGRFVLSDGPVFPDDVTPDPEMASQPVIEDDQTLILANEVVGSIHRPDHRGETERLLREAFE